MALSKASAIRGRPELIGQLRIRLLCIWRDHGLLSAAGERGLWTLLPDCAWSVPNRPSLGGVFPDIRDPLAKNQRSPHEGGISGRT
ncbi:hypothetical protein A5751_24570 [Mycolicibacterium fortuitum]|nr:hypothetical protein A5751_24570 [Mycolicibacterium fortuitum]